MESISRPCFPAAVERKRRKLWACQEVAYIISASPTPLARPMGAGILAALPPVRDAPASWTGAGTERAE